VPEAAAYREEREVKHCHFCWRWPTGSSAVTGKTPEGVGFSRRVYSCDKHSDDAWDLAVGFAHRMEGYLKSDPPQPTERSEM
jgi:hypothetical protein